MAEQKLNEAYTKFDTSFPSIKPGEVAKMNEMIALLTPLQPLIGEIGGKDPNKGNEFAQGSWVNELPPGFALVAHSVPYSPTDFLRIQ